MTESGGKRPRDADKMSRVKATVPADFVDRAVGFITHAEVHLERGNAPAVREALDDLRRLCLLVRPEGLKLQ
jgi:hypothetical protein